VTTYGIDFGTTNSALASCTAGSTSVVPIDSPPGEWQTEGFDRVLPSVVAVDGDGAWTFGWDAKQPGRRRLDAAKRLLATEDQVQVGTETLFVEEAAGALFGRIRDGGRAAGVEFDQAVITIPANSRGLARYRTRICAGLAGIETLALINEPTAAAMAFGAQLGDDERILVVDLGGGTLDVTVLHAIGGVFMEQASAGVQRLGGIDFDQEIARRVMDDVPGSTSWSKEVKQEFLLDVELAKIRLTSRPEVALSIPGAGARTLTRAQVAGWVEHLVARLDEPVNQALERAGMHLTDIDHLLLIGGSCKMPAVRDRIVDLVRKEPAVGIDPMTAVAEGAAVAAAIVKGEFDASFFVTTEHSLGTIVHEPDPGTSFSVIIPKTTTLPARESGVYLPVADYQDNVILSVVEGDERRSLDDEMNVMLAAWEVPIPNPGPLGEVTFEVMFEYDTDGIIHVSVTDQQTGLPMYRADVGSVVGRSAEELVGMHERVEDLRSAAPPPQVGADSGPSSSTAEQLPPEVATALDRARSKVAPMVAESDAAEVLRLADALEASVGTDQQVAVLGELETLLRKWSYLF
jgi:molecular chaperone DnaK